MMEKKKIRRISSFLGASIIGGTVAIGAVAQACTTPSDEEENNTYNRNTADYWLDTENADNEDVDFRAQRIEEFELFSVFIAATVSSNTQNNLNIPSEVDLSTYSITALNFENFSGFNQLVGILPSTESQNITLTNIPNSGPISTNPTLQRNVNDSFNYLNYMISLGGLAYSLIVEEEGWNTFFERSRRTEDPDGNNYITVRSAIINNIIQILDNSRYIFAIERYVGGDLGRMLLGVRAAEGVTAERGFLSRFLSDMLFMSQQITDFDVNRIEADIFAEFQFPVPNGSPSDLAPGSINEGVFLLLYRDFVNTLPRSSTINFTGNLSISNPLNSPSVLAAGYAGLDNRTALSTYTLDARRVYEEGDSSAIPDSSQTNIYLGISKFEIINPEGGTLFLGLVPQ